MLSNLKGKLRLVPCDLVPKLDIPKFSSKTRQKLADGWDIDRNEKKTSYDKGPLENWEWAFSRYCIAQKHPLTIILEQII